MFDFLQKNFIYNKYLKSTPEEYPTIEAEVYNNQIKGKNTQNKIYNT